MTETTTPPMSSAQLMKDVNANVSGAMAEPIIAEVLNNAEESLVRRARPVVSGELREIMEFAHVFAASGFFTDAQSVAKAAVKIIIGRSLDLSDIAALSNVYLFESKGRTVVIVGVHILAAKIKTSTRYRFKLIESTDKICRIEFYEKGFLDQQGWTMIAEESFTIEEAMIAAAKGKDGVKDNWKGYPKDMLYARAMARGFRRHTSDLIAITPYVPEEFTPDDLKQITAPEPSPSQRSSNAPRRASDVKREKEWPAARQKDWMDAHEGEGKPKCPEAGCQACNWDAWTAGEGVAVAVDDSGVTVVQDEAKAITDDTFTVVAKDLGPQTPGPVACVSFPAADEDIEEPAPDVATAMSNLNRPKRIVKVTEINKKSFTVETDDEQSFICRDPKLLIPAKSAMHSKASVIVTADDGVLTALEELE